MRSGYTGTSEALPASEQTVSCREVAGRKVDLPSYNRPGGLVSRSRNYVQSTRVVERVTAISLPTSEFNAWKNAGGGMICDPLVTSKRFIGNLTSAALL
jgi:hypothetical protein